jgi:hypothetical protein
MATSYLFSKFQASLASLKKIVYQWVSDHFLTGVSVRQSFFIGVFLFTSALFGASLCNTDPRPKSACAGWESLQQLRTLIPERVWEQEFAVKVRKKAFRKAMDKWSSKTKKDSIGPVCMNVGSTHDYFLRSTFSGENVRLLDRYQEFQTSPFWNNPDMMDDLKSLESKRKSQ